MRFTGIEKVEAVDPEKGLIDLVIGVEIDPTIDSRYELVEPKVWATCVKDKGLKIEGIQLTDNGMIVHGFEFNDRDREEVLNLIEGEFKSPN